MPQSGMFGYRPNNLLMQGVLAQARAPVNPWVRALGNQGSISNTRESLGDKAERGMVNALTKMGMEERHAHRFGRKAFSFVNDLTPVGNITGADQGQATFRRGITQGDLGQAALGAGVFGLSVLPAPGALKKIGGTLGENLMGRLLRDESGAIRAWHGSPHDFDRFDLSKIGTGEGAQGQGHGLYFASNKQSAKWYADTYGGDGGRMYEVALNATPKDMLDWNRNLGDLPKPMKERLRAAVPTAQWDESGMQLYARAKALYGSDAAASTALRQAGIPGVRYQGQKGQNYVVFDDNLIDILNKY